MLKRYPNYFGVTEEPAPISNAVEGKQPLAVKQSGKKKMTFDDLDEFQKKAALNLQKTRGISIEDYIKKMQNIEE
jgi:hypothetical protein